MRCCNFIYYAYYANVKRICKKDEPSQIPCSIFRSAVIFSHLFLIEVGFFFSRLYRSFAINKCPLPIHHSLHSPLLIHH
jgi:hypothetical protein